MYDIHLTKLIHEQATGMYTIYYETQFIIGSCSSHWLFALPTSPAILNPLPTTSANLTPPAALPTKLANHTPPTVTLLQTLLQPTAANFIPPTVTLLLPTTSTAATLTLPAAPISPPAMSATSAQSFFCNGKQTNYVTFANVTTIL